MKYCKECNNYFEDDSLTVCPYCKDRQVPLFDADEPEEEMSPQKRATVRVLSAIGIIIIACLLIWGVDWLLGLIKGLL